MIDTASTITNTTNQATRLAAPNRRGAQTDPSAAPVFAGLLDRARTEGADAQAQLREASEKLVSTTFIMPMFEKLRNDPLATNLMHGGRAEKIFQQQLDQVLSDRVAGATNFDLVDSVYNQLARGVIGKAVNTHG